MTLSLETRVVRSDEPTTVKLGEELVMLSEEQSKYFALDEVGTRIWECLATPSSIQSICDRLGKTHGVPTEQCTREALAFLGQLHDKRLIRVC